MLSLIEGREGVLTAFAEGQEARGSGEATATVRIAVTEGSTTPGEEHATVRFTADLTATGRLTEFDAEVLAAAGRRLLDRFAAALASEGADPGEEDEDGPDEEGADGPEATVLFLEDRAPTGEEAGPLGEGFEEAFGDDSLDDDLSDLIAFSDADAERFGLPTGNGSEEETGVPAGASGELPTTTTTNPCSPARCGAASSAARPRRSTTHRRAAGTPRRCPPAAPGRGPRPAGAGRAACRRSARSRAAGRRCPG